MRDDDVTSHVTILNFCISLVSCIFRRPRVPNYYSMSYETRGCSLFDDVTSHVTILNFSISLVSCLFQRLRVPNYSNMPYETQGFVLFDDVTSHVTILNLVISPKSCLFLKPINVKLFTTCYMRHKEICQVMTSQVT